MSENGSDVYAFLASFNAEHGEGESYSGEPQSTAGQLTEAPEIQPCEFGFECNNCGYCH